MMDWIRRLVFSLVAGAITAGLLLAHEAPGPITNPATGVTTHYPRMECWCVVENVRVHDADTVTGDVLLPWGVTLRNQTIRANDFDAWESSKRRQSVEVTDAEVVKGKKATAEFLGLIKGGQLNISPGKRDRDVYGRLLGSFVVVKGGKRVRLADWAEENGHLRKVGP